ncbi:hypothetical protein DXG01_014098 [Tephrocybe rancida]|nr:hypothetical protein DXG01_014098 [Tephrocybe rancida]
MVERGQAPRYHDCFINLLSGSNLKVGGSLESCTSTVQAAAPFELDGHRITLIDTPGFDDSSIRDTDVLTLISAYLSFEQVNFATVVCLSKLTVCMYRFQRGRVLTGVIYMHRILDNRLGGISSRNFKMFRNLCGDRSLKNVAIVTSFWDGVDPQVGESREKELASKDIFFKPVLDKGARLARHSPWTLESAQTILRSFFGQLPEPLQIQNELDAGADISETSAGKELNRELAEQIMQHQKEMRALIEGMDEATRARDEETRKELAEDRERLQEEIKRVQIESRNMASAYAEALTKLQQQVDERDHSVKDTNDATEGRCDLQVLAAEGRFKTAMPDNAVLEAKLGGAFPVFGFWGKLSLMLSPFSLSWK